MHHVVALYRLDGILLVEYPFSGAPEARRCFARCKENGAFGGTVIQRKVRISAQIEHLREIHLVEKDGTGS